MRCKSLDEAEETLAEMVQTQDKDKKLSFMVVNCLELNNGFQEYRGEKYCFLSALECPYQVRDPIKRLGGHYICGRRKPHIFKYNLEELK